MPFSAFIIFVGQYYELAPYPSLQLKNCCYDTVLTMRGCYNKKSTFSFKEIVETVIKICNQRNKKSRH